VTSRNQLVPLEAHGVKIISMAVLVPPDKPMILRGPMLHGVVRQFLTDVDWGELDYLIVDMPPGTGDVQLSLAQLVPVQGAVLVTTPQAVSLSDVRRAFKMFEQVSIPVLGIIENMSYFLPPDMPDKRYNIFGTGGGQRLAEEYNIRLLGEVPLGMEVREGGDNGIPVVVASPDSPQAVAFRAVAEEVARQISIEAMKPELVIMSRAR
jgi:ATP-binding protein involved in chromosome partitioning